MSKKKKKNSFSKAYKSGDGVFTSSSNPASPYGHKKSRKSVTERITEIKNNHERMLEEEYGMESTNSKTINETFKPKGPSPLQELLARTADWGPKHLIKKHYDYSNIKIQKNEQNKINNNTNNVNTNSIVPQKNVIKLGSKVTLVDLGTNEHMTFEIVNSYKQSIPAGHIRGEFNSKTYKDVYIDEFDTSGEYVRDDTPIAQKLRGKTKGIVISVNNHRYRVLEVVNNE